MIFPLYPLGAFGLGTGLALAVLIGFGFGFTLERGGFGSSRRLAAQFYLYDLTVFKVMFTAIVTAMLGLFGLTRLGLVDLSSVWINPTFLWPQIVGGFLLGVGFVVSGYCPGTAIVASASGKLDGMLSLLGVGLGITLYAAVYTPALDAFQKSGAHGRLLLSDLIRLSPSWLALLVALMAAAAFLGAEKLERLFARRAEPGRAPRREPRVRNRIVLALLAVGLILLLPPRAASPARAGVPLGEPIAPLDLARALVEGTGGLTVLDLRDPAVFARGSIPGSINLSPEEFSKASTREERWSKGGAYVLVEESGGPADLVTLPPGCRGAILRGGYAGWQAEILSPPPAASASVADAPAGLRERWALYAYFSGAATSAPRAAAPPPPPVSGGGAKKKPGGGC